LTTGAVDKWPIKTALAPPYEPVVQPVPSTAKPWDDRKAGECQWIIGDVPGEMRLALTCCARTAATYCGFHAELAFRAPPPKQRTGNELARALRRYI
jgi:hypothetical protein